MRDTRGTVIGRFCVGVRIDFLGFISARRGHAQPPDADSRARRARERSALLVYQTLDAAFAHRPRLVSFDRTDWRMDRRARRNRQPGAVVAVARRAALDGWF